MLGEDDVLGLAVLLLVPETLGDADRDCEAVGVSDAVPDELVDCDCEELGVEA